MQVFFVHRPFSFSLFFSRPPEVKINALSRPFVTVRGTGRFWDTASLSSDAELRPMVITNLFVSCDLRSNFSSRRVSHSAILLNYQTLFRDNQPDKEGTILKIISYDHHHPRYRHVPSQS
jgi:hypothetical protein